MTLQEATTFRTTVHSTLKVFQEQNSSKAKAITINSKDYCGVREHFRRDLAGETSADLLMKGLVAQLFNDLDGKDIEPVEIWVNKNVLIGTVQVGKIL